MVAPFTLTRSTKSGYQALDVHTATEIGIDEAGFDEPVRSDDESGWDWHHPTVITMKSRQIAVGEKLLNVRSEPNRETERERVPVIEIGQYRERNAPIGFEAFRIFLPFGRDHDDLTAGGFEFLLRPDERIDAHSTIRTPVTAMKHNGGRTIGKQRF